MANFFLRALFFGALSSGFPFLLGAQPESAPHRVVLDAESWSFDQQLGKFEFNGLKISQDGLSIEAENALGTGFEFEDSAWQLMGNVRIAIDSAVLMADEAAFTFENQQLTMSALTGSPAVFDVFSESRDERVHGSSDRIYFDKNAGTVRMEGSASLVAGQLNARGCEIVYSLRGDGVKSGDSECGERFQITIETPADDSAPDASPPEP